MNNNIKYGCKNKNSIEIVDKTKKQTQKKDFFFDVSDAPIIASLSRLDFQVL